ALLAALSIGIAGCATSKPQSAAQAPKHDKIASNAEASEPAEAGEIKVKLDQTPDLVRQTIQRELAGAELEDIAKKQRDGKTVYETDIIKSGQKWEVIVAEDGSILS